jgi:hypothetical protein
VDFIVQEKYRYPLLSELVFLIQQEIALRSAEEVAAIAFVSVLLGGKNWLYLPKMIERIRVE